MNIAVDGVNNYVAFANGQAVRDSSVTISTPRNLTVGNINTGSSIYGGNVNLVAGGRINIGNIEAENFQGLFVRYGGSIQLIAPAGINTGIISTQGAFKSGNVTLRSTTGNIEVEIIEASSSLDGRSVNILTNALFRANSYFTFTYRYDNFIRQAQNVPVSIRTSSTNGGVGSVSIRQGSSSFVVSPTGNVLPPNTSGTAGIILVTQGANAHLIQSLQDQTFNQNLSIDGFTPGNTAVVPNVIQISFSSQNSGSSGVNTPSNPNPSPTTPTPTNINTVSISTSTSPSVVTRGVEAPPQETWTQPLETNTENTNTCCPILQTGDRDSCQFIEGQVNNEESEKKTCNQSQHQSVSLQQELHAGREK